MRGWRVALSLLLAVGLLLLFFRGVDWNAMGRAFRAADPLYLCGVVLVTARDLRRPRVALGIPARAARPRALLAALLGHRRRVHERPAVPRAGEVVAAVPGRAAPSDLDLGRLRLDRPRAAGRLITVLLLFALYLYVLPTPAAQTRGPLLAALKVAGAGAGAGALAVLAVLLLWHRHAERAMRAGRPRCCGRSRRGSRARCRGPCAPSAKGSRCSRPRPSHLAAILGQSLVVWLLLAAGHPLEQPRLRAAPALPHRVPDPGLPDRGRGHSHARHGGRLPRLLPRRPHRGVRRGQRRGGGGGHRLPRPRQPAGAAARAGLPRPRGAHRRKGGEHRAKRR